MRDPTRRTRPARDINDKAASNAARAARRAVTRYVSTHADLRRGRRPRRMRLLSLSALRFQPTPTSEEAGDPRQLVAGGAAVDVSTRADLRRGRRPRAIRAGRRRAGVSTHADLRRGRRPGVDGRSVRRSMFQPTPTSEEAGDRATTSGPGSATSFNPRRPPKRPSLTCQCDARQPPPGNVGTLGGDWTLASCRNPRPSPSLS